MPKQWLASIFIATSVLLPSTDAEADGDPGFAALMGTMQRYLHKLDLSVQHDNAQLASFYIHELEETVETIESEIENYDGHPVGQLTGDMMTPSIEALEAAMEAGKGSGEAMTGLVNACNACHAVTDHGYIQITRTESNPFNQSFAPNEDT